jgi:capsule polysaccharide modification protein KpsS
MINNNNSKILIGMDGKQIRPKRGQYRRYESEQLAKAVAAVLSNEMSVHKAGSYFGVPHSTVSHLQIRFAKKYPFYILVGI